MSQNPQFCPSGCGPGMWLKSLSCCWTPERTETLLALPCTGSMAKANAERICLLHFGCWFWPARLLGSCCWMGQAVTGVPRSGPHVAVGYKERSEHPPLGPLRLAWADAGKCNHLPWSFSYYKSWWNLPSSKLENGTQWNKPRCTCDHGPLPMALLTDTFPTSSVRRANPLPLWLSLAKGWLLIRWWVLLVGHFL